MFFIVSMAGAFVGPSISHIMPSRLRKRPGREDGANSTSHICDQCSKGFGSLASLNRHRGASHKKGHQPKRRRSGSGEFVQQNAAAGTSFDGGVGQEPRPPEINICPVCKVFNSRKRRIDCIQCRGQYHVTCVNMRLKQAEELPNYICRTCKDGSDINSEPSNADPLSFPDFDLLRYLITCKSNLSIMGNIPRGARIAVADALNELIGIVLRTNSSASWSRLLCFTYHVLQKPKKDKPASNNLSLVTKIKNQVSAFMNENFPPDSFPFELRKKNAKPKSQEEILKNRVNAKFAENDLKGAIRELSSEDTLAPDNAETLKTLGEKHPTAPIGCFFPPPPENNDAHTPFSSDSVKTAILSFPAGSAGGQTEAQSKDNRYSGCVAGPR